MHNAISKSIKSKNSVVVVEEQIEKTNEEILYFDSLLQQMEALLQKILKKFVRN